MAQIWHILLAEECFNHVVLIIGSPLDAQSPRQEHYSFCEPGYGRDFVFCDSCIVWLIDWHPEWTWLALFILPWHILLSCISKKKGMCTITLVISLHLNRNGSAITLKYATWRWQWAHTVIAIVLCLYNWLNSIFLHEVGHGFGFLWEVHGRKPSTYVLTPPKPGALREVARDNMYNSAPLSQRYGSK